MAMTDNERVKVEMIREAMLLKAREMIEGLGVEHTPELEAEFVGTNMATLDALFAIRDGEAWRGRTDPQEIAREVLRIPLGTIPD